VPLSENTSTKSAARRHVGISESERERRVCVLLKNN
jgi:hypothetical protein